MQKYCKLVFALLLITTGFSFPKSLAADPKGDIKRGKKVFMDMQCAICHANGGNLQNPEKPLMGEPFLKRYPLNQDKAIAKVIREGIISAGMPASGKDKMSDQDLADVIAYVRSLTPTKSAKPAAKPVAKKGKAHK